MRSSNSSYNKPDQLQKMGTSTHTCGISTPTPFVGRAITINIDMPIDRGGGRAAHPETPRDCVDRPCVDRLWVECSHTQMDEAKHAGCRAFAGRRVHQSRGRRHPPCSPTEPTDRPTGRPINQPTRAQKAAMVLLLRNEACPRLLHLSELSSPLRLVMIQKHCAVHRVYTGSWHVLFTPALLPRSHPVLFQFWCRPIPFSHCAALSPFDTFGCTARPSPAKS